MSELLLKYLTGKRLACVYTVLLLIQVVFLVAESFLALSATFEDNVPATRCLDSDSSEWLYPRGKGSCDVTETDKVVFAFQLPLAVNDTEFVFTRWQQYLLGMLQVDMPCESDTVLTIDARLAYRNHGDPDDGWKHYASSVEQRVLTCNQSIPLFALGSLHHKYYLLNIRLPQNKAKHLRLLAINQTSDCTKISLSLKTALFSFVINVVIAFWKRKRLVPRPLTLLEYMILFLGLAITFLNMPLEYLTLVLNMPFMLLLNDIRQNIFYAALLSFWLVFPAELVKIHVRSYWKYLAAVVAGCLSLFIFHTCQHAIQLHNPFSFMATSLALTFNILAAISAAIYFFLLCYVIWRVFCNLSIKHTVLPNMSVVQMLIDKRFFDRLKVLMLITLLCAALTVIEFIVGRCSERYWGWNGDLKLEHTSIFFMGIYTMWNMYASVVTLFCIPVNVPVTNPDEHQAAAVV